MYPSTYPISRNLPNCLTSCDFFFLPTFHRFDYFTWGPQEVVHQILFVVREKKCFLRWIFSWSCYTCCRPSQLTSLSCFSNLQVWSSSIFDGFKNLRFSHTLLSYPKNRRHTWCALRFAHTTSSSSSVQETGFQTHWYRVPWILHKMFPSTPSLCLHFSQHEGTYLHMFWSCLVLKSFWGKIFDLIFKLTDVQL